MWLRFAPAGFSVLKLSPRLQRLFGVFANDT
jgi:hypothetical protein